MTKPLPLPSPSVVSEKLSPMEPRALTVRVRVRVGVRVRVKVRVRVRVVVSLTPSSNASSHLTLTLTLTPGMALMGAMVPIHCAAQSETVQTADLCRAATAADRAIADSLVEGGYMKGLADDVKHEFLLASVRV